LATLLWAERCRSAGLPIPWAGSSLTGSFTATVVLATGIGALLIT
jgi:hypothetical protein